MAQEWYYTQGDRKVGPVSAKVLKQAAADGTLQPTTLVWTEGMKEWKQARSIKGLAGLWPAPTPAAPPPVPVRRAVPVAKPVTEPPTVGADSSDPAEPASVAQQWWLIGLSLLCCFPAGLVLVWIHPRMSKSVKGVITGVVGVFCLAVMATSAHTGGRSDPVTGSQEGKGHPSSPGGEGNKPSDRYFAPYKDFDGESDRLMRSDAFLAKPPGAKELPDEPLTGEFLPFFPGAESYYQQYAFLGGIAWTEYRMEDRPDGTSRMFTTTFGLALGDGQRRTTKKDFPGKESERQRRRERDGRVEIGMESGAGGVVDWTPLVKRNARQGDSWPSLLGETDEPKGTTRLTGVFEFDGRACAVVVEDTDQGVAANGRRWRARNGYWLLKGVGIVRHELSNDLDGTFKAVSRSLLEVRKFGK
jgi:hypothetical protein